MNRYGRLILLFLAGILLLFSSVTAGSDRARINIVAFSVPGSEELYKSKAKEGLLTAEWVFKHISNESLQTDPESTAAIRDSVENSGGEVFYVPHVETIYNMEIDLEMVSDIQYFSQNADGSFALKNTSWDESAGFWVHCLVHPSEIADRVTFDYELLIRVLSGRKKIPGLNLDVGEPSFHEYQSHDRLDMKWNEWTIIDALEIKARKTDASDILMIMVQVNRLPE